MAKVRESLNALYLCGVGAQMHTYEKYVMAGTVIVKSVQCMEAGKCIDIKLLEEVVELCNRVSSDIPYNNHCLLAAASYAKALQEHAKLL